MIRTSFAAQAQNRRELRQAEARLETVVRAAGRGGRDGVGDLSREAVRRVRMLISRPYPPASEAGQPPAARSYALFRSFRTIRSGGFESTSEYDPYLEFGTRKMAPRPHVRVVVATLIADAPRIIGRAVERAEREAARGRRR